MRCVDSVLKLPVHQKIDLQSIDLQLQYTMLIEWSPAENYDVVFPTSFGLWFFSGGKYVFASKTHYSERSQYSKHRIPRAQVVKGLATLDRNLPSLE